MNAYITDDAEIIAHCLANATEINLDTIEVGDTVRYTGKRQRWVVGNIVSDTHVEVYTFSRNPYEGRGETYTSRNVALDRIELIHKGNPYDDAINAFMAAETA